jgi:hypothetical protein
MRQREDAMFDPRDAMYNEPTMPQRAYRPPRNTYNTRPILATIAALLLIGLAATLFAVFGRPSSNPANGNTPTATTQPTATIQPTATPQPTTITANGAINSGHPCVQNSSSDVYIGDLRVSRVNFLMGYPAYELPATLAATQPYQLPAHLPVDANGTPNPPVNPYPNYGFMVCNTSSATSHVLVGVTVRIAAFSAFNGILNTWQMCDGSYQRPIGAGGGGCGGGYAADEFLKASFAANATTGSQVTATQVSTGSTGPTGPTATPLPISLGPGQMLIFSLSLTLPTAPGTYTFAFGLNYDAVTAAPISTMQPTIFDSAAVKWNGQNCTKPTLLSQIPASDTTNRYVCAP